MAYDASDRKQVRRAEKAAALADLNRREVLISLVGTPAGRQWVWDRIARAGVFESVYNDASARMYFLEGKRSEGLDLLSDWMSFAPDQFIEAMREANQRRTENATKDKPQAANEAGQESLPEVEESTDSV